jgi:hypothetical protein
MALIPALQVMKFLQNLERLMLQVHPDQQQHIYLQGISLLPVLQDMEALKHLELLMLQVYQEQQQHIHFQELALI